MFDAFRLPNPLNRNMFMCLGADNSRRLDLDELKEAHTDAGGVSSPRYWNRTTYGECSLRSVGVLGVKKLEIDKARRGLGPCWKQQKKQNAGNGTQESKRLIVNGVGFYEQSVMTGELVTRENNAFLSCWELPCEYSAGRGASAKMGTSRRRLAVAESASCWPSHHHGRRVSAVQWSQFSIWSPSREVDEAFRVRLPV